MRDAAADGSTDGTGSDGDSGAQKAHSEPDYAATEIPTGKPPEEYTYTERRADLYQQIIDLGHPDHISRVEQGDRFGVDASTISRDIQAIAQHVRESRIDDLDRRVLDVQASVSRAVRELQQTDDVDDTVRAAELAMEYDDWCWDAVRSHEIEQQLEDLGL